MDRTALAPLAAPRQVSVGSTPIRVIFALLPYSLILDWAGPAEALRIANQLLVASGKSPRFELVFASPDPDAPSSVGVALAGLQPLPSVWETPAWVVLIGLPGVTVDVDNPPARKLLHWLRGLRLARGRIARGRASLRSDCQPGLCARFTALQQRRRYHRH